MIETPLPVEESQLLEDLLQNIEELVILATPAGRILWVNRAWREQLGYDQKDLQNISAHDVLHPMHAAEVQVNEAKLLAGETLRNVQRTFITKDGRQLFVEGTINYRFKDARPVYARAVFRDITLRKKAEAVKDEVLAMASHELRSPLTAIIGALEMIKQYPDAGPKMLDMALRNSQRMLGLINDYLDVEKVESGGAPFNIEPLELSVVVEHAIETNRTLGVAGEVGIELSAAVPGAKVNADAERLTQVLTNLLSNAIKFSPEKSTVNAAVSRNGTYLRVSVTDQGPGISDEFRGKIFSKFEQAGGQGKGGSGLGLAITKAIVERLGGHVGFESRPGAGATFYFELPELKN